MLAGESQHEVGVADEPLVELPGDMRGGIRGPETSRDRLRLDRHSVAHHRDGAGAADTVTTSTPAKPDAQELFGERVSGRCCPSIP